MNILEIKDLHTYFTTKKGIIKAVNGVSLSLVKGKTLGVIGESGSGKSQTAMSILKLFEKNQSIHKGEIIFDGRLISEYSDKQLRDIRGNEISMIFQEPMTSLNPVLTIGKQISEVIMLHQNIDKSSASKQAIEMLRKVKIANPETIAMGYPHQLSGGMRQRVMIAIALSCKPKLLIADEPTTALDVTIQAQILVLMNQLKKELGSSILFITHDLGVIRQMVDDVAVMYCGQVVETAPKSIIFDNSSISHPYTKALLQSSPSWNKTKGNRLEAIAGNVPSPLDLPVGCKFSPRCKYANEHCYNNEPELLKISEYQSVRCFYPEITRCENE